MVWWFRYDDPPILAGQGTAALEVIEQMDKLSQQLDAVVIPVGGGGLLAGMAITLKHLQPRVKVIVRVHGDTRYCVTLTVLQAVESEKCASFSAAQKEGKPVHIEPQPSLADGLAVPKVSPQTAQWNLHACTTGYRWGPMHLPQHIVAWMKCVWWMKTA